MLTLDLSVIRTLLYKYCVHDDLVAVRLSSRAKRLILKSSIEKAVEIVVPYDANMLWVLEMLENRIPWIKCAQKRIEKKRRQLNPDRIDLEALGETWSINYKNIDELSKGLSVSAGCSLMVGVHPKNVFYAATELQKWFQKKARASLLPWLMSLAEDRGLTFNQTYIRNQSSRWGSCSQKRNINLNRNLLFISRHLVEYVLHHELTHLDHMNHSPRFWDAFSKVIPDCQKLRRELRSLNLGDIPLWASSRVHDI